MVAIVVVGDVVLTPRRWSASAKKLGTPSRPCARAEAGLRKALIARSADISTA